MEKLILQGGRCLNGTIQISGMKNSALPILYACALTRETCILENVPDVSDVRNTVAILSEMGVEVKWLSATSLEINAAHFVAGTSSDERVRKIRASSYLMGVELGRAGKTRIGLPGGCSLGARPLDQHIKGFEILGAEMTVCGDYLFGEGRLHEGKIMLDIPSVGATVNLILAATLTPGTTTIGNAAREPHIVDLANFLNMCGANVFGAGTSEIKIEGVPALHGCHHTIVPDMIEAGTYMAAVAGTGGCVTLQNVIPKHLESITGKLIEMGVTVTEGDNWVTVCSDGQLKTAQITTAVYPGFPTDMHPQFSALLCVAQGSGTVVEKIFENRFAYVAQFRKMGATIVQAGNVAEFQGGQALTGAALVATDLRAGAAMVIAALMADGQSEITNIHYIDRGYDGLIEKLTAIGACIQRVDDGTDMEAC